MESVVSLRFVTLSPTWFAYEFMVESFLKTSTSSDKWQTMSNLVNRITADPEISGDRPCIRGLRVHVKDVLDMLAGGSTRVEILEHYPYLEDEDITAALEFASRAADHPVLTTIEQRRVSRKA